MNKKILIVIVLAIVVLLSSIAVYINNQRDPSDPQTPGDIVLFDEPAPEGLEYIALESQYEYTDAIISPNTIASDPNAYTGRVITTRGWITEISPGQYLVLSINRDEVYGPQLATKVDIDFSAYASSSTDSPADIPLDTLTESKPVTITGELTILEDNGSLVFLVSSLTQ
jgi:hypothetical protein